MNILNPKSFNEKINWIKFEVRNPLSTTVADKYTVRDYVKSKVGESYLIPLHGAYNRIEDIDFRRLPSEFVIKYNSGSGFNYICNDLSNLVIEDVKSFFTNASKVDIYSYSREWHYRHIKPKILVEHFLGANIKDYKFHCNRDTGPFCIQVDSDRFSSHKRNLYDLNWKLMNLEYVYPNSPMLDEKPINLELMVHLACELSRDFIYSRIDFYEIDGRIYFGEITLHPEGGLGPFRNYDEDLFFGSLVNEK